MYCTHQKDIIPLLKQWELCLFYICGKIAHPYDTVISILISLFRYKSYDMA